MHDAHGGGHLVHVLPARAAGVEDVHAQVVRLDVHVHFVRFRQHGDRGRGGVYAALGLGYGHALHAVDAALVLQGGGTRSTPSISHTTSFNPPCSVSLVLTMSTRSPCRCAYR